MVLALVGLAVVTAPRSGALKAPEALMTKATRTKTIRSARTAKPARNSSTKDKSFKPRIRALTPKPRIVETRAPSPSTEAKITRKAALLALLTRPDGAELSELVAASGWQVHSVRAALTHFRQAGHVVNRVSHEDGSARYTVVVAD